MAESPEQSNHGQQQHGYAERFVPLSEHKSQWVVVTQPGHELANGDKPDY